MTELEFKIRLEEDFNLIVEIYNKSNKTLYILYDNYEQFENPPKIFIKDLKGKNQKLNEFVTTKIKIAQRKNPPEFIKIEPLKPIIFLKTKFIKAQHAPPGIDIKDKNYYEISWPLNKIITGIKPGRYKIQVFWESKTDWWYEKDILRKKENVWLGKLTSNEILIELPKIN